MSKLCIANWKSYLLPSDELALANQLKDLQFFCNFIICPSFISLKEVSKLEGRDFEVGAQDIWQQNLGAYTGQITSEALESIGVLYVIIGHSELRALGLSNQQVLNKVEICIKSGLIPIVCVGEDIEVYNKGLTFRLLDSQLEHLRSFDGKVIIAYEPIWAIGTGLIPNTNEIEKTIAHIKHNFVNTDVLYGGSVNEKNCKEIFSIANVDGLLIGGASTKFEKLVEILRASVAVGDSTTVPF